MLDSLDTLIAFSLVFTVVSLLVTIVVQIVTTLLNLRGLNLSWAVAETFETIEPTLAAQVKGRGKQLADHVLRDPLLSDKQIFRWVFPATAVRPDELFDVLHRIATGRKQVPADRPDLKASAISLLKALGLTDADLAVGASVAAARDDAVAALSTTIQSLPDSPEKNALTQAAAQVTARLNTLATAAATQVAATATTAEQRVTQAYQKFETWLDTGQERAQEWFSMHARLATLIVALFAAFILQLDTIDLFHTVSSNRAVRDKLVAQTDAVLGQGEKLLGASPTVLADALASWKASLPPATKPAIDAANLNVLPADTRGSLRQRVEAALASLPDRTAAADALAQFDAAIDSSVHAALQTESAGYQQVKGDLDKTGVILFPQGNGRWGTGWLGPLWSEHTLGMLFSVLLLSLGAPFWFNTLKSLASLRSTVAGNIGEEDEAAQKQGGDKPPGTPPPTVTPPRSAGT